MTDEDPPPPEDPSEVAQQLREEVLRLHQDGYGTRKIRARVEVSRKVIRRILLEAGCLAEGPPGRASKLGAFADAIAERVQKGLTASRILRKIRALGFQGGRTILAGQVRTLRATLACEACGTSAHAFALCDDRLHVLCPACDRGRASPRVCPACR